ncbi:microtubule associated protein-domain-containing protein [Cristinia sonorae]|uniref:Microtubule associated protein-domain-containing protein n=1 Tax=Cristinia sonorae TaxID=1940300 RepID=A0A8K0USZ4_9AGAR|nr:microtubule associated protein-domain-containing protein [Cristinia sonorae]
MASTTITSLLNSLHTHLQSQTQLLPTLHSQLGLPPTALADDLSSLQQQLTQCVEIQIDSRRKQVDEWMQKCSDVEEECIRYSKALGSHMKVVSNTVGEVRKELVLPRRFDMITECQEKLRQLYHTKLEQLLTLTSRLKTLSRTLGAEYFPADVLEPTPAVGESEFDASSHRDVTPERFSKLEKELVRGKGEVTKRLSQLSQTMIQIDWLYTELGIVPPSLDDLPSSANFLSTRPPSACSTRTSHSNSSDPFLSCSVAISTPTPDGRSKPAQFLLATTPDDPPESEYERIFAKFVARIEELSDEALSSTAVPTIGLEGVDPTPGLITWAEAKCASLEDIKRRRETHIQAMYDQLEALWRRLGVAEEDMDRFVESQRGSTEITIRAYEEELDRMLELKRERMSTFVENARTEIVQLWDELMVGQEERADFAPFADDEHTEELLSIHEEEIRRLKEDRKMKGPLLNSIKKYFDICEDEKELAAAAQDQSRLLGRGPRDPGRLLREEKMRKRVTKEKPKLEQDLLQTIPTWEAETGRQFLVHGESILQILMVSLNIQPQTEKENNKRSKSRSGSVPPRATTPPNPIHHYVPPKSHHGGSTREKGERTANGGVTPAVRPGSSMSRSGTANKRPKLGESTSSHNNAVPPVPPVRSSSRGASGRAASPSKIPGRTVSTSSGLPRPAQTYIAMPVPKHPSAVLGHGRAPSSNQRANSYHPYPQTQRSTSASSQPRVHGAVSLGMSAGAVRKASRARRESFKPRPSVDEVWTSTAGGRYPGFSGGVVTEENEDYD